MTAVGLSGIFMMGASLVLKPVTAAMFAVPLSGTLSMTIFAASL